MRLWRLFRYTNDRPADPRVMFHRTCALVWLVALVPASLWWRDSVWFVIVASVYANVKSDWSASEAADDSEVLAELAEIKRMLRERGD